MKEGGAHCVKLGAASMAPQIERMTQGGIPVMAHIGFTPQSEHTLGGYRVQGAAPRPTGVLRDALAVQEAGAFAVVMEMVPGDAWPPGHREARHPTIGIGAGNRCDGQVLVWQDAFGLRTGRMPRFVKQYADLRTSLLDAAPCLRRGGQGRQLPGT